MRTLVRCRPQSWACQSRCTPSSCRTLAARRLAARHTARSPATTWSTPPQTDIGALAQAGNRRGPSCPLRFTASPKPANPHRSDARARNPHGSSQRLQSGVSSGASLLLAHEHGQPPVRPHFGGSPGRRHAKRPLGHWAKRPSGVAWRPGMAADFAIWNDRGHRGARLLVRFQPLPAVVRAGRFLPCLRGPPPSNSRARHALTLPTPEIRIRGSFFPEGYPSGQREQTVNLPAYAFEGSNPSPSTILRGGSVGQRRWRSGFDVGEHIGGCSSMVEPQPSKLMAWVRFPSPAPVRTVIVCAHVAQLVEHFLGKDEVTGSIPVVGTSFELQNRIFCGESCHVKGKI